MRKVTSIRWIGLVLLLILAVIGFWPTGSGTVFAQPPEPGMATITGTVLYNGRPVVEHTSAAANFWARNENTNERFLIDVTYDSTAGTYVIPNVPPGRYLIAVEFDSAPPFNGHLGFPGDLSGSKTVVVSGAQNMVRQELSVSKIIHLTSPVDNQKEIGKTSDPEDTYAPGQLRFLWEAIPEATYYTLWVDVYQKPYKRLSRAFEARVSTLEFKPTLPLSHESQFYQFILLAWNADDLQVGKLMVRYTNGYGWDYRFRIVDSAGIVNFPDPNLEAVIRKHLKKHEGAIYTSDLESLTELRASLKGITNLSGLEHCINLESLWLYSNQISDISPLVSLIKLRDLDLSRNQISDISPLTKLPFAPKEINVFGPNYKILAISPIIKQPRLDLSDNPLNVVSANIHVPLLRLRVADLSATSAPVLLTIIITIVLVLIAICIRRLAGLGMASQVLQVLLFAIAGGLACYFANNTGPYMEPYTLLAFFPSFIVGFGTVATFWSFRDKSWNLVGWLLIVLAVACYLISLVFLSHSYVGWNNLATTGLISGPGLVTAGALFLIRRSKMKTVVISSVIVLLAGLVFLGITFFIIELRNTSF